MEINSLHPPHSYQNDLQGGYISAQKPGQVIMVGLVGTGQQRQKQVMDIHLTGTRPGSLPVRTGDLRHVSRPGKARGNF